MMRKVLEKRKRVLGEEHPDISWTMGNLAATVWKIGPQAYMAYLRPPHLSPRPRVSLPRGVKPNLPSSYG